MVKIYTKVGDHGQTKQVTGQMVDKDDARLKRWVRSMNCKAGSALLLRP